MPSFHQPTLRVKRLSPEAIIPVYQTAGAAGLDLSACLPNGPKGLRIEPSRIVLVPTGLSIEIPDGYEGQVRPRSGLATRHGITLPNAPGTIDSDYRGELFVPLINLSQYPFEVLTGMRIAQLVIAPVSRAMIEEVADLTPTHRGQGGFGSTGA